ncbi:MAG: outer membrane beta-barrel protein [Elusimicrobia bacterium]|nr:outer membrane beta-barrel protein [Elusimicrobiota bacterium]
MKKVSVLFCLTLAVSTRSPAVGGETWPKAVEIDVQPGYAILNKEAAAMASNSFSLGVSGYFNINRFLAVGTEMGSSFKHRYRALSPSLLSNSKLKSITGEFQTFFFTPSVKMGFSLGMFKSYVMGGGGWYSIQNDLLASVESGNRTMPLRDLHRETHTGWNTGIGVGIEPRENISLGLDLRYHLIHRNDESQPSFTYLSPSLRLGVSF